MNYQARMAESACTARHVVSLKLKKSGSAVNIVGDEAMPAFSFLGMKTNITSESEHGMQDLVTADHLQRLCTSVAPVKGDHMLVSQVLLGCSHCHLKSAHHRC